MRFLIAARSTWSSTKMCKTSSCSLIGSCLSTEAMFSMLSVRRIVVECPRGRNLRSLCIPFQHVLELCTTIIGWKQPADCEYLDTKLNNRWIKIGPKIQLIENEKNCQCIRSFRCGRMSNLREIIKIYIPRIRERSIQRRIWFVRLHSLSLYFGKIQFRK